MAARSSWLALLLAAGGMVACGGRTGLDALGGGAVGDAGPGDGAEQPGLPDGAPGSANVVLFGGSYHTDLTHVAVLGDTWTWDGARWTEQNVAGPSARAQAVAATLGSTTLLFGGGTDQGVLLDETWTWDGAQWTERHVAGPPPRAYAAMATLSDKLVLFGGGGAEGDLGDTWTWDGQKWAQEPGPAPPARVAAAAATLGAAVVLYGGQSGAGSTFRFLDDTWTWDGSRWTEQHVAGPNAQLGGGDSLIDCSAASAGDRVVLLCGGQTWTWDGASWSQQPTTGPFVELATMTSLGSEALVFGGWNGTQETDATWIWTLGSPNWAKLPGAGPPARQEAAMASR